MYSQLANSVNSKLLNKFELDLVNAALKGLDEKNNPLRFNTFALTFRELTRIILHRLSPNKKVLNCQWYTNETDKKDGITRIQRMLYAIKGGISDDFIEEELNIDINDIVKSLKKVIDILSKYTHINQDTFYLTPGTGENLVRMTLESFNDFINTIEEFRMEIQQAYEIRVSDLINDAIYSGIINEIDILATHYLIDYVGIDHITIDDINDSIISIEINGYIDVEHQYGSDGDYRRGDGVRVGSSYPYQVQTTVDVNYPLEIHIGADDIEVDNSKFYE
ncbi:hypothetical protein [Fictibacillus sp. S7]|uniref:pPIWI-associating nuclease domain-containing protein n=1 Tax=Fictibacillus sp. S7 TaxID=2212476 RepID=UPI0010106A7F|nr:hypothetical protein [Fictibacillus sp. S7]RXY98547.1 hypothetical protein DMO16_02065 [Fictibacillus sp. S7]